MRQTGDDQRINPFESIRVGFIGQPSDAFLSQNHWSTYKSCKVQEKMMKFCAQACSQNDNMEDCANACSQKFEKVFDMHLSEKTGFNKNLAAIQLNGGSKYDALV